VATTAPTVAARLILLAAVADGLDGVLARHFGGTEVGEFLDSLADVASFCVAPAVMVVGVVGGEWGIPPAAMDPLSVAAVVVPALFVAAGVARLALYTAYDIGERFTEGVQTTLAATILAAGHLASVADAAVLLGATAVFAYLMITAVPYPELCARDALGMGIVQVLAIIVPGLFGRAFPRALLVAALGYLLLAPRFYWREG